MPRHEEVEKGGGTRLPALQSSGGNRIFQSAIGQGSFHQARGVALGMAETRMSQDCQAQVFLTGPSSSNGFACSA